MKLKSIYLVSMALLAGGFAAFYYNDTVYLLLVMIMTLRISIIRCISTARR